MADISMQLQEHCRINIDSSVV